MGSGESWEPPPPLSNTLFARGVVHTALGASSSLWAETNALFSSMRSPNEKTLTWAQESKEILDSLGSPG